MKYIIIIINRVSIIIIINIVRIIISIILETFM